MYAIGRDLRYAFRQLRRSPGFSAFAIASLAIGIGAPTTIFTLVNAILLRPLPVRDAGRLVYAYETSGDGSGFHSFSYLQYRDLNARSRTTRGLTAFDNAALSISTGGEPRVSGGMIVSGNYFAVLGALPQRGRFFVADEDGSGTSRYAVVVSDAFWRSRLGSDPEVIGRTIRINGQPFTIIGVTRPDFADLSPLIKPEVFTTIGTVAITRPTLHADRRSNQTFQIVGRLADGATSAAAQRELQTIARQVAAEHPDDYQHRGVALYPFTALPTEARAGVTVFMALLMGLASLILSVACGNVISMQLARAIQRQRELAIRSALGAARGQLMTQVIAETILLSFAGAVGALGLTAAAARSLAAFRPPVDIPLSVDVPLDWRVFAFAAASALVFGTIAGLLPALRATRANLSQILKEQSSAVAGRSRARSAIVVGQMAFAFVLLVAAGLVGKALGGALRLNPGFDRSGVSVALTDLDMGRLDDAQARTLAHDWQARVAATPGVATAGLTTRAPLGAGNSTNAFKVVGGEGDAAQQYHGTDWAGVSPEFFATLAIRIVAGRNFGATDIPTSERVAIVSETLARRYFGGAAAAIGRALQTGDGPDTRRTIVGVAADIKIRSLTEAPRTMMYEPVSQLSSRHVTLVARSPRPDLPRVMSGALRSLNAAVPVMGAMSYDDFIGITLLPQRLAAVVSTLLGFAGLLLAVIGVYGIVAYSVTQRTREIGIRIAIGATSSNVIASMAASGLRLVAIGIGAGLLLSLAGTRVMSGFLLGVSPTDPIVFVAITAGLGAIALIACIAPAGRAARVDPLTALRSN
jgi:putative ABC transport system permease protein